MKMKKGDIVNTPRFLKVEISEVLTRDEAWEQKYTEPTHYHDDPNFAIYGKMIGVNRMEFAAVIK
jgi:hypothetical protein